MAEHAIVATVETALGWVAVAASTKGLLAVTLPQTDEPASKLLIQEQVGVVLPDDKGVLDTVLDRLRRYYAGEPVAFDDPLDMGEASRFQRAIWCATRQVPRGATTTYGALARQVGAAPGAARAVGRCMATNRWPPVVPCHRVLGQDGSLTGFAAGIATKRRMLELEGVLLPLDE